jgi:DNA-binding CsgD family transcriptional regulator
MAEDEFLSTLIGKIYDAALDPDLWPSVIGEICAFVGGMTGILYAQDSTGQKGELYYDWGLERETLERYFKTYARMNPLYPARTFLDVGEVYSATDLVSVAEIESTRFHKEWALPMGSIDTVFTNLERSSNSIASFSITRSAKDGQVDSSAKQRMRLVAPHIRRSVLIGKVVDQHKLEALTFAEVVDGLVDSVFLVNSEARITFANRSGQAMLDDGHILRARQGVLVASDPDCNPDLREALKASADGDIAVGEKGVSVTLSAGATKQHLAHLLPLTSGARFKAGRQHAATAAICVRKAALDTPSPLHIVSDIYKLTASEVRTLSGIVEIGGVAGTADALGISEATVKTHLQRIFDKTGVRRQADLVKLVAAHASPFRPSSVRP